MEHRAGRPAVRPANVSAAAGRRIASRRAVERSRRLAALRVEPVDRLEPVTADGVATTEDDVRKRHHLTAAVAAEGAREATAAPSGCPA